MNASRHMYANMRTECKCMQVEVHDKFETMHEPFHKIAWEPKLWAAQTCTYSCNQLHLQRIQGRAKWGRRWVMGSTNMGVF